MLCWLCVGPASCISYVFFIQEMCCLVSLNIIYLLPESNIINGFCWKHLYLPRQSLNYVSWSFHQLQFFNMLSEILQISSIQTFEASLYLWFIPYHRITIALTVTVTNLSLFCEYLPILSIYSQISWFTFVSAFCLSNFEKKCPLEWVYNIP